LSLAGAVLLASCSPQSYAVSDPSKTEAGIVFDIGGKDDRSFNAAAWNGMKCAESGTLPGGGACEGKPALGVVVRDVEPGTPVSIVLVGLSEELSDTMSVTGFLNFFTTCETFDSAIKMLNENE
jgi:hypothetical protein